MEIESEKCPKCQSLYCYQDGMLWICPECFYEWSIDSLQQEIENNHSFVDINGTPLENGDDVIVVKDLKIGKETIKSGTKAKNIRLLEEPVNGHDISCKIPKHGQLYLKCSVVKKA